MRITYLHQYFRTPAMSGGTRSYEMATRMVRAGHRVLMISARSEGAKLVSRDHVDGIEVVWIRAPYDNRMSYLRRIWAFVLFAVVASWMSIRHRTDVVFATSTPLTIIVPGWIASRIRRAPLVFEVRDLWPDLPIAVGALRSRPAVRLARALERFAYRSSTHVIALSTGMKQGVVRAGCSADDVTVIPNACDLQLFLGRGDGHGFRAERRWLGEHPLVTYAGTLGKINDVGYLVDVAAAAADIAPDLRFLVVGDGAEHEAIERRAVTAGVMGSTFFMEDSKAKSDMPSVLAAATVATSLCLPLPELEANSANKFFDALASGTPLAINYGGWQAELVRAEGLGIVLTRDPVADAQALATLASDAMALDRASLNCQRVAAANFDRDVLVGEVIAVLVDAATRAEP